MENFFKKLDRTIAKTQEVRLIDVFILSPFMIWFGIKAKGIPQVAKTGMVISGILTGLYNGRNYLKIKGRVI